MRCTPTVALPLLGLLAACDADPEPRPHLEARTLELSCSNTATFEKAQRAPGDPETIWAITTTANPGGPRANTGRAVVSHDGGDSYDSVLSGAESPQAFSDVLAVDRDRALLLASTNVSPTTLVALATTDGGRTTHPATALASPSLFGRQAEAAWELGDAWVALLDGFAYVSRDRGARWEHLAAPNVAGGLYGQPNDGTTNGDGSGRLLQNPDCGIDERGCTLASWDHGVTTAGIHLDTLPAADYPLRLIGPPGHLLVGGPRNQGTGRGGIFTSRDGGLTWDLVWDVGRPLGGWVDPKDDSAWIPLAVEQTGIGAVLRMQLLVLRGWGESAELYDVSAGGVPLIGMEQLRRVGDEVELIGTFAPTETTRERLACRFGPSEPSHLDALAPALPLAAPPPGEMALVARRFESTFKRTSLAFDPGGNPWVLQDNHLMGAPPPSGDWWLLGLFDAWDSTGPSSLVFDERGRLVVAQGPRQYSAAPVRLFELDPVARNLLGVREWDTVRIEDEAGNRVVPIPRRLMQRFGDTWIGTGDFTLPADPALTEPLADYRNARLPGAGSFSPDGRWFAWVMAEAERYRDGPATRAPIMVGSVLDGRFADEACAPPASEPHPPSRGCFDYEGEAWVVGVTDDRLVLVLDRIRGVVVARRFEDPTTPWTRVAEGLLHPTDMVVRTVAGVDVVFVHDADVFAFTPTLGQVARRRLTSDATPRAGAPVTPYVPPVTPTSEDPYGCVADRPCIKPDGSATSVETLRVVLWMFATDYRLEGERLGTSGTLFVDGVPHPTTAWGPAGVQFDIGEGELDRPDGELWIEVDGVASNRLRVSTAPVVERVEPSAAEPGEVVSILGRNFGASQGDHALSSRNDVAGHGLVTSWSDTRVDFIVEGAQSGVIRPTVYKHGMYPAEHQPEVTVLPRVVSGCRGARDEPCELRGASLGAWFETSATIGGRPAEVLGWSMSRITLAWPAGLEPGAHEAVLRWPNGTTRAAPVVLDSWARAAVGPMSPEGHNLAAHDGGFALDGDGVWFTAVGFTVGVQGDRPIPGPPTNALLHLTRGDAGLSLDGAAAPRYRTSTELEDLPWVTTQGGEVWLAGSAMSATVQAGPNGLDLVTEVRVRDPREARVLHRQNDGSFLEEDVLASAPGETGRVVGLASVGGVLWLGLRRADEPGTRLLARGEAGYARAAELATWGGFIATEDGLYVGGCGAETELVRAVDASGVVAPIAVALDQGARLERCVAARGGGLLAVGVTPDGARSLSRVSVEGRETVAELPSAWPMFEAGAAVSVEDLGYVGDAPALLLVAREGAGRGLRLVVWSDGAWRARGGPIADVSNTGPWVCSGPWGNRNECMGDMGSEGCAYFACPAAPPWRERSGWVGRARLTEVGGQTTVLYEQWFDDGRAAGDALGDHVLMAATFTP